MSDEKLREVAEANCEQVKVVYADDLRAHTEAIIADEVEYWKNAIELDDVRKLPFRMANRIAQLKSHTNESDLSHNALGIRIKNSEMIRVPNGKIREIERSE